MVSGFFYNIRTESWRFVLWLATVLLSIVLSFFLCAGVTIVVLPVVALVFFLIGAFIIKLSDFKLPTIWLSFALLQFFFFPIIYMLSGLPAYVVTQIFLMLLGVPFVRHLLHEIKKDNIITISFLFLIGYFITTAISTLVPTTYDKSLIAIVYQSVALVKPYLILAFCFGMYKLYGAEVRVLLYRLGSWLWLPMLLLIALQFTMPGVFKALFPFAIVSPEESGLFPSRALGVFESSSYLAAFAAFYAIFYCSHFLAFPLSEKQRVYCVMLTLAYICLVLLAIQRQELSALFLSLMVIFILYRSEHILWRVGIAGILLAGGFAIFMSLFGSMTEKEFATWGENRYTAITHPRANLYDAAFQIADDYFPLGSGIGSYAGAGSTKFNLELFYKMGFAKLWWFGKSKEKFLLDSYWANPIAEAGYLGAGCLVLHYLFLLFALIRKLLSAVGEAKPISLIAVGSLVYVLMTSVTSPSFIEPRIIFFPFLAIAMAYGVAKQEDANES